MSRRPGVGIVVVSHSPDLAHAAVALASEMLHGQHVPIAVAAGLDDGSLGTSAPRIQAAVTEVDGPAGVLVLMDIGSALLSAEVALESLPDPVIRDRVVLSPAPLVEGLIVAAVAAAGGADRDTVAAQAAEALLAKATHLGFPHSSAGPPVSGSEDRSASAGQTVAAFTVHNQHGLHARPASSLVAVVNAHDATVELRNLTTGGEPVPGDSLTRVATLAATHGHRIEVRATGPQAVEVARALVDLAGRHFDEYPPSGGGVQGARIDRFDHTPLESPDAPPPQAARTARGPRAASPGIAIGPAHLSRDPRDRSSGPGSADDGGDPGSRLRRITAAVAEVRRDIEAARRRTLQDVDRHHAAVFDAHLTLLADPDLLTDIERRLTGGAGTVEAWTDALRRIEEQWAGLPDPHLSTRSADVRAVADQVLRVLSGIRADTPQGPGVLVARDVGPAEVVGLDPSLVTGVVLAHGSPSSHAAILARARGIPMLVGAGEHLLTVPEGTTLVLDGGTGDLHIDPQDDVVQAFRRRAKTLAERRARDTAAAPTPAITRDGVRVHVAANVGSVADAAAAAAAGAEGAGLVRTEFLFLGRATAPSAAEQETEYRNLADALSGRPITLRTLDVGADKPLPYVVADREANPFLGLRGIRLALDRPELIRDQLTAICRTAQDHPVSVMFPMVSAVEELQTARRLLSDAAGPGGHGVRVGMMVEVPAAALRIEHFLPHLDFISIGTNDLTQYMLAAERGNPSVASLSDSLDPAVLALIAHVCRTAHGRAHVAVCGETASDHIAIPVLVGLGVRELSVTPAAVPSVKALLRRLDARTCHDIAQRALTLAGPDEVRALVRTVLGPTP